MPNHFHGIICITDTVGALLAAPAFDVQKCNNDAAIAEIKGAASSAPTLGKIMRIFKSISAIEVNRILDRKGQPLWQRNYYDRIIRDEKELAAISEYIALNPIRWAEDKENPDFTGM
jgi:REP element-mobilizing transposase RayT